MIRRIVNFITGVELKRENFNPELKRIFSCAVVIVLSYLILIALFPIIDNLIKSSDQTWYADILAKYSFVAVSIRIIFISLFTNLNNPLGRFKAAFILQLVGFIGGAVMHSLLSGFVYTSPNINPIIKSTYGLLPFVVGIVIFVAVRKVYTMKYFDEDKFFSK